MLNPDFRDMLSYLNEEGAEYIVVGAYALAAHGFPRATGDIDIWVRRSVGNSGRVVRALKKFGAPMSELSAEDFAAPDMVVQIGVQPCRIDITTGIDGIEFDAAWGNRVAVVVDGIEVNVPSKADLLKNKVASGRDKDQGDIAWLRKHQDEA